MVACISMIYSIDCHLWWHVSAWFIPSTATYDVMYLHDLFHQLPTWQCVYMLIKPTLHWMVYMYTCVYVVMFLKSTYYTHQKPGRHRCAHPCRHVIHAYKNGPINAYICSPYTWSYIHTHTYTYTTHTHRVICTPYIYGLSNTVYIQCTSGHIHMHVHIHRQLHTYECSHIQRH